MSTNLNEVSAAFCYRIYDSEFLKEIQAAAAIVGGEPCDEGL